ncbi:MAG: hypothetical protein FJ267_04625 [Planctomycetes bacterium]|nr:hypothetical protein [Planctomycetota bacterium]
MESSFTPESASVPDRQPKEVLPVAEKPTESPQQGLLNNLSRDVSFQVFGSIVASGLMLLTMLAITGLLDKESVGSFGRLQVFGQWCATFFSFGGGLTITIFAGRHRHTNKSGIVGVMAFYLALVLILTSVTVGLEQSLGLFQLKGQITWLIGTAIMGYAVVIFSIESCQGLLRGTDRYGAANLFSTAHAASIAIGTIAGAYFLGTPHGALWSGNALTGLLILGTIVCVVRHWGATANFGGELREIGLGPGLRNHTVQVVEVLSETFGVFYLTQMQNLTGVATLFACQKICTIISKPASMMSTVVMGKVAGQRIGQSEVTTTLRIANFTFLLGLLSSIPLLFWIEPFTVLALGNEYRDASIVMALHLIGAVFRAHASAAVGLIVGSGCTTRYLWLKVIVLATTVGLTSGLYPWLSLNSAAVSYVVTSALLMIGIRQIVIERAYDEKPPYDESELDESRQSSTPLAA